MSLTNTVFWERVKFVEYVKPSGNCGGYWKLEILENSLRSDLNELSINRGNEMEKEYPILPAYGIYPSKSERTKFKTENKVDLSEKGTSERQTVFMSLPEDIRDGADVYIKPNKIGISESLGRFGRQRKNRFRLYTSSVRRKSAFPLRKILVFAERQMG